jgi:hypothetical protein
MNEGTIIVTVILITLWIEIPRRAHNKKLKI